MNYVYKKLKMSNLVIKNFLFLTGREALETKN